MKSDNSTGIPSQGEEAVTGLPSYYRLYLLQILPQYGSVSVYASRITDTPGPDNYTQKVGPAGRSWKDRDSAGTMRCERASGV